MKRCTPLFLLGPASSLRNLASTILLLLFGLSLTPRVVQAQTAHFSWAQTTVGSGSIAPFGVAVDGSGNVYIADSGNNRVLVETLSNGSYTQTTVGSGLGFPMGVAVDGSGNVYIADYNNDRVLLETLSGGSYTQTTLFSGLAGPSAVAVDGSGNVYIANAHTRQVLKETLSGGSYTQTTVADGLNYPVGVAVDGSGNVYFANDDAVSMYKLSGGSYTLATQFSVEITPVGVAVDGSGNVYIANNSSGQVLKETLSGGSYTQTTVGSGLSGPWGVAVDGSGNVYVADNGNSRVLKLQTSGGVDFGKVNVGSTSAAISLVFTFDTAGTLGSMVALTQGSTGLDFANAGTGSCTAGVAYTAGSTCTVDVTFTPKFAGTRYGAVVLNDSGGNAIATGYVYGTGSGPQPVFEQSNSIVASTGGSPTGLAVDSAGTVYVGDQFSFVMSMFSWNGSSVSPANSINIGAPPLGIAQDGAGNLYVSAPGWAYKVPRIGTGYGTPVIIATSLSTPMGIAVDSSGDVFIADTVNDRVFELPWTGSGYGSQITILGAGLHNPYSIALDGTGNLYIADTSNSRILKLPKTGTSFGALSIISSSVAFPVSLAVDPAGDVYIADQATNTIYELPWTGTSYGSQQTVLVLPTFPLGIAIDGAGNLYVSEPLYGTVIKLPRSTPPSLTFASTVVGATSADSPQPLTIQNIGNASLTLPVPTTGFNPSISAGFTLDSSSTCPQIANTDTTAGSLGFGATCTFAVNFKPQTLGANTGSLVLTDDALNASPSTTQNIPLSGTATPVTHFVVSAPATTVSDTAFGITVTAEDSSGNTVTGYNGTVHFTSSDPVSDMIINSTLTNGTGTFSGFVLDTAGSQTITATDSVTPSIAGTSNAIIVTGGAATYFTVMAPASAVSGQPFAFTVTAYDPFGNLDTHYAGTVSFSSSDTLATLPGSTTLSSGTATLQATLQTVGTRTISATGLFTNGNTVAFASNNIIVANLPAYKVTVLTDATTGVAANCTNQNLTRATTDANCSLRDAIAAANVSTGSGTSTITFLGTLTQNATTASPAVITLNGKYLDITGNMKILGPGANLLQVSGNNLSGVFQIEGTATATLDNLTITGGNSTSGNGGGGITSYGNLTVSRSLVTGNTTTYDGGGILSDFSPASMSPGTLTVTHSTVSDNVALETASGYGGGGISIYESNANVDNSTIVGNSTSKGIGGGIFGDGGSAVTLTNSTIAQNSTTRYGGGIDFWNSSVIANTIVVGNISGNINVVPYTDNGGNIFNQTVANLNLSPLGYYGGPTPTMVPLPGSAAIGYGIGSAASSTDQRGASRPTAGAIDSGAVQTSYALAFTTEPPAMVYAGAPFTAALTLSENGSAFPVSGLTLPLSAVLNGNSTALSGLTTDSTGLASSNGITLNTAGSDYTLVSTLPLTSSTITPAETITATSTSFAVDLNLVTLVPTVTPSNSYSYLAAPPVVTVALAPSNATGISPTMFTAVLDGSTALNISSTGTNVFTVTGIPSNLTGGSHSIQVSFAGTGDYAAASVTIPLAVTAVSQTLNFAPLISPVTYGVSPIALQATPGASGTPVTFAVTSGPATVAGSTLGVTGAGTVVVTASEVANSDYTAASSQQSLVVNKAPVTVSVTPSSASPVYGTTTTITVNVAGVVGGVQPTGTVILTLDGMGTTLTLANGTASFNAGVLVVGPHTATASYAGDTNYLASTTASASVSTSAINVATGTLNVAAADAVRVYGTANPTFIGIVTGAVNGDSFTESFSTTAGISSNAGAYPIVPAAAGPNLVDYTVNTTNGTLTITRAASASTLASSSSNVGTGVSLTLTATVASSTMGIPTGSVAFFNGSTQLGTATLDASGSASMTTSFSAIGTTALTAVYAGDTNFNGSNSGSVPVAVVTPGFTLTANASTLNLTPGQTGQVALTLTPVGDISGQVTLGCTIPKVLLNCAFTPQLANFGGDNAVQNVALTVGTYGPGTFSQLQAGKTPHSPTLAMIWWLPAVFLGGLLSLGRRKVGTPLRRLLLLIVLASAAFGASGCGSGYTYTAAGTDTITITATGPGGSPQTLTLTVNVQ